MSYAETTEGAVIPGSQMRFTAQNDTVLRRCWEKETGNVPVMDFALLDQAYFRMTRLEKKMEFAVK